jgi:hypothetical protein
MRSILGGPRILDGRFVPAGTMTRPRRGPCLKHNRWRHHGRFRRRFWSARRHEDVRQASPSPALRPKPVGSTDASRARAWHPNIPRRGAHRQPGPNPRTSRWNLVSESGAQGLSGPPSGARGAPTGTPRDPISRYSAGWGATRSGCGPHRHHPRKGWRRSAP